MTLSTFPRFDSVFRDPIDEVKMPKRKYEYKSVITAA